MAGKLKADDFDDKASVNPDQQDLRDVPRQSRESEDGWEHKPHPKTGQRPRQVDWKD